MLHSQSWRPRKSLNCCINWNIPKKLVQLETIYVDRVFVITHFLEIYPTWTSWFRFFELFLIVSYNNDTFLDSSLNRDIILVTCTLVVVLTYFSNYILYELRVWTMFKWNGLSLNFAKVFSSVELFINKKDWSWNQLRYEPSFKYIQPVYYFSNGFKLVNLDFFKKSLQVEYLRNYQLSSIHKWRSLCCILVHLSPPGRNTSNYK